MASLIAYTRVSSEVQEKNTSLEEQLRRITMHSELHGHQIVTHFQDVETATGKRPRKGFNAALAAIYENEAEGLICTALDRFARNTMEVLRIAAELKNRGKQLVILNPNLDTSDAVGQCIFTVLLAFAQFERDTIYERTQRGHKVKVEAGEYSWGAPPFGWDSVEKRLVENPVEQKWRRCIIDWYSQGVGTTEIAHRLRTAGVKTKTGREWRQSTVYVLLHRPLRLAHLLGEEHERISETGS